MSVDNGLLHDIATQLGRLADMQAAGTRFTPLPPGICVHWWFLEGGKLLHSWEPALLARHDLWWYDGAFDSKGVNEAQIYCAAGPVMYSDNARYVCFVWPDAVHHMTSLSDSGDWALVPIFADVKSAEAEAKAYFAKLAKQGAA